MPGTTVSILILDDNELDAMLIRSGIVREFPSASTRHAASAEQFKICLEEALPDLIVADYRIPSFTGADALTLARRYSPIIPFILVSGSLGDDEAVHLLKQGATDFLSKDRLYRLPDVIRRALDETTERQRAQTALRESEARYRAVVESAREMIYTADRNGDIQYANPAVLRVSGYSLAEISTRNYLDLVAPEARTRVKWFYLRQLSARTETSYLELPIISRKGEELWFGQSCTLVMDGDSVTGVQVIARDITRQILSDRKLARSLSLLQAALDSTADGILVVNRDQGVETYNSKFLDLWRIPEDLANNGRDEVLLDFVMGALADPDSFRRGVAALYDHPQAVSFDTIDLLDGRRLERYSQPQFLDGKIVGRVWSFRDITQQHRSDEQLRNSHLQLRALTARLHSAREDESARIAREIHDELGQALTGLKMDLRWIEKRLPPDQQVTERIRSMSELIGSTINTVRRIATELRPGILDSLGLVAAIEWQAQDIQARTGLSCTVDSTCGDLVFPPDEAIALFRIAQEALTNVTRHAGARNARITLAADDATAALTISDDGKGISGEELHHPHSLGLLGMRERLMPFGGTLNIYGSPGEGTTVKATLPVKFRA